MSYEVLARKWRPRSFPELVGQDHVRRALANALDTGRLHHAYLFAGTRGVGKTTIARILAKSLNCESQGVSSAPCGTCGACQEIDAGRFVDLIEVDAASRTRVDETRELLENVPYAPTRGRCKVYLIDEVHMFSQHSFNALLKTLEEPPPHVKFLLATTDPQKVPVTILSRCLQFNLRLMPVTAIVDHLEGVLAAEGVAYEEAALGQIARAAAGSMRDALSLVDQAVAFGDGAVCTADVEGMLGTLSRERLFALVEALAAADAETLVSEVDDLARQAADLEPVLGELLALFHQIAMAQTVPATLDESIGDAERVRELAARMAPADVQLYYQIATMGRRDLAWAPDPRTGLEMTLLRMLAFRPAEPGDVAGVSGPACPARTIAAPPGKDAAPPSDSTSSAGAAAIHEGEAAAAPQHVAPHDGESATAAPAASDGDRASAASGAEVENGATSVLDWEATVAQLGLRGLAAELAAHTAPVDFAGERLRLALGSDYAHLANDRYRQRLEQALQQHWQHSVRVELVDADGQADKGETPAGAEQRRHASQREAAREAIDSDPVVQALRQRFDAEVQSDSIEPAPEALGSLSNRGWGSESNRG